MLILANEGTEAVLIMSRKNKNKAKVSVGGHTVVSKAEGY